MAAAREEGPDRLICAVYKSQQKADAYLYVEKKDALTRVPEALLTMFGKPELAMTLMLAKDKKLANVDAARVIECVHEQGYYLQMSQENDDYMLAVHKLNNKFKPK